MKKLTIIITFPILFFLLSCNSQGKNSNSDLESVELYCWCLTSVPNHDKKENDYFSTCTSDGVNIISKFVKNANLYARVIDSNSLLKLNRIFKSSGKKSLDQADEIGKKRRTGKRKTVDGQRKLTGRNGEEN